MDVVLALIGVVVFLGGLVAALFLRGRRKKGLFAMGGGVAVFVVAAILGVSNNGEMKAAGFADYSEFSAAKKAGFADAASWRTHQHEEAEKAKAEIAAKAAEEKKTKEAAQSACKSDLQCWGDKNAVMAAVTCQPLIEKMAKWDHKWTDGILEPKFSRFRWRDQSRGVVTYVGDKLQLQNGFGAWGNVIYECDFEPTTERVSDIRITQGRL